MSPVTKKTTKKKPAAGRKAKKAPGKKSPARKKTGSKKTSSVKKKSVAKKKATSKKKVVSKKKTVSKKKIVSKKAPVATKGASGKKKAPSRAAPKAGKRKAASGRAKAVALGVHPRFGQKFECFACKGKFYDMGKEDPICPKCETDQRDDSNLSPKSAGAPKARKAASRPMAPLLDDDEAPAPSASEDEDLAGMEKRARSGEGFFDDAAVATEETEEAD